MAVVLGRKPGGSGGGGGAPSGPAGGVLSGTYPNPGLELTAKGNLIVATAADTAGLLAVGTNGYHLEAASGEATGIKWAPPAAGLLGIDSNSNVNFTTASNTAVQITGVSLTVTVPAGGRSVMVSAMIPQVQNQTGGGYAEVTLWVGVVGSGTLLQSGAIQSSAANESSVVSIFAVHAPAAGSITYNLGLSRGGAGIGTAQAFAPNDVSQGIQLLAVGI